MLGLVTLVTALWGTVYFVKFTDENWKWKVLMAVMTLTSLVLQFVIPVHFLIPLGIQTVVAIWTVLYWKISG